MCASSAARPCAPMPFSGGPTSILPMSPSLWHVEQVPVKSALPLTASPGFSISGVSVAMMSSFAWRRGLSVSSRLRRLRAICRLGCVRSRATLAGPSWLVVIVAGLQRRQQRARRFRPPHESDRTRRSSSAWRAAQMSTASTSLPGCRRRASRSAALLSGVGAAGAIRIGPIAVNAAAALRRHRRAGWRRGRRADRRSSSCRVKLARAARRACGVGAAGERAWPCPISRRWPWRTDRASPDRRAAFAAPPSSPRPSTTEPPLHARDRARDRGLERCRGRAGAAAALCSSWPALGRQRADGATAATNSARPSAVGVRRALGDVARPRVRWRAAMMADRVQLSAARDVRVERRLALARGRRRRATVRTSASAGLPIGLAIFASRGSAGEVLLRQPPRRLLAPARSGWSPSPGAAPKVGRVRAPASSSFFACLCCTRQMRPK